MLLMPSLTPRRASRYRGIGLLALNDFAGIIISITRAREDDE